MGRIPENEYIEAHGCRVVTMQMIEMHHTPAEVETFGAWFTGQTGMILDDGTLAIYSWDYERWLEQGRQDCQSPLDWD